MLQLPGDITQWGATTLLVFVVILILTDRLVTKGRLKDSQAETEIWRKVAETEQKTNATNAATIQNYAEAALVTQKVMKELQDHHREREEAT